MEEQARTITLEEVRAEAERRSFALQMEDDQASFTLSRHGKIDEDDPPSFDVTPVGLTCAWCWLSGYILDVYDDGFAVYRPYGERKVFTRTTKGLRTLVSWVRGQESSSKPATEENNRC